MPLGSEVDPYDLIVIGKGSAAAYYLESIPRRYASLSDERPLPLTILVIGEDDPWAKARGYVKGTYGQNINQASQVLAHRQGKTAPVSQSPQDRQDWARQNERILSELAENIVTATVTNVVRVGPASLTGRSKFKVSAGNGQAYFGYKIVIATGAGIESDDTGHKDYHMVPPQVSPVADNPNVMNLDRFMQMPRAKHSGKRVAILGPTAGTDAVMQAGTLGYPADRVWWLMRTKPNTDGFLNVYPGETPTEKQQIATIIDHSKKRILAYEDPSLVLKSDSQDRVQITCTPVAQSVLKDKQVLVDYFVYSTGQTASNTLTAPPPNANERARSMLASDLMQHLEPVYDINQRLGEQDSAPWQHVTAVQLEGSTSDSGLLVIGAATFQVSAKMDHTFLQFDYLRLLDQLLQLPGFETCARVWYPGLLQRGPLKDVPRLSREECVQAERAFLEAWREHCRSHLQNYEALGVHKEERTVMVEQTIAGGRHLCYLFAQRTQAAQYLFQADGALKRPELSVQRMLNPTHTMPSALQDCRLLAAVNANVGSTNASSPKALAKKTDLNKLDFQVNFLESKTELRVYLSAHYPDIPEHQAQAFIGRVSERRKQKGNMGFELYEIVDFELELERLAKAAQKGKKKSLRLR